MNIKYCINFQKGLEKNNHYQNNFIKDKRRVHKHNLSLIKTNIYEEKESSESSWILGTVKNIYFAGKAHFSTLKY